jgi:ABC-type sugar transport system permease subunit
MGLTDSSWKKNTAGSLPDALTRFWGRNQRTLIAYLMVLPAFLLFMGLVIFPLVDGFWISLHRWDGLSEMEWLGFKNYKFVFGDEVFWLGMRNTFQFAFGVTIVKNVAGLFRRSCSTRASRGARFSAPRRLCR